MLPAALFWGYATIWLGYTLARKYICSSASSRQNLPVSEQELQYFLDHGFVVISGALTADEVAEARRGLHSMLRNAGVDVSNLVSTATNLNKLSSTGGSGGVLDVFYGSWKLKLNEHPQIFEIISTIWSRSYATCSGVWQHPFGEFDPNKGFMYIDRVCFRLPERISMQYAKKRKGLQRSLTPHLDCCPANLYEPKKPISKWRPVQIFLALTDTLEENQGGFECVSDFHHEFNSWADHRPAQTLPDGTVREAPCVGDFTPIRPKEDADVIKRFQHVSCKAGDLVIWDWRLPHANAFQNNTNIAREVVYLGFLPYIQRNAEYARDQLRKFECNEPPTDQWHNQQGLAEPPSEPYTPSTLGRRLLGIDSW